MLTTEQLMIPRYKVIADYPKSVFEVGDILREVKDPISTGTFYELERDIITIIFSVDKYPHIFKLLSWWQERSVEDMPPYIKPKVPDGGLVSAATWGIDIPHWSGFCLTINGNTFSPEMDNILPATQSEYEAYKNGTK